MVCKPMVGVIHKVLHFVLSAIGIFTKLEIILGQNDTWQYKVVISRHLDRVCWSKTAQYVSAAMHSSFLFCSVLLSATVSYDFQKTSIDSCTPKLVYAELINIEYRNHSRCTECRSIWSFVTQRTFKTVMRTPIVQLLNVSKPGRVGLNPKGHKTKSHVFHRRYHMYVRTTPVCASRFRKYVRC